MSVRSPSEVPTIEFDPTSAFAGHHLVATMCFPDAADRHPRLAAIGADMANAVEDTYGEFFDDVVRTLRFHRFPPPKEALGVIIDDCARDGDHRNVLMRFVENAALPTNGEHPDVGLVGRFWCAVAKAPDRFVSPRDYIRAHLVDPFGGETAIINSPSFDTIRAEIADCIRGHPMLAGLSFYLVATIDAHHKDSSLSYSETYRIISGTFDYLRVRGVDWLKTRLPRWHCVASLWAGFSAKADCWLPDDHLLDIDRLQEVFFDVFDSSERRRNAISYGAWFSNEFVNHPSANIRRGPHQLIRFPDTVSVEKPTLRPLAQRVLNVARRYR
jgi:hypothetical protein